MFFVGGGVSLDSVCTITGMTFDNSPETATAIPESFKMTGAVRRRGEGGYYYRRIRPMDIEAMRFILTFKYANVAQIAGWLGCSKGTAANSMTFLVGQNLVDKIKGTPVLFKVGEPDTKPKHVVQTLYRVTSKGRSMLEPWVPAGTDGVSVIMPDRVSVRPHSPTMVDHSLGVVDLAIIYRRWGCSIIGEREIAKIEPSTGVERGATPTWSPPALVGKGRHQPDFGVVLPDAMSGARFAVELERSVKSQQEYRNIVQAYMDFGLPVLWYVGVGAARRNLVNAYRTLGVELTKYDMGAYEFASSADGTVRVFSWVPGFTVPNNGELAKDNLRKYWALYDKGVEPGGFRGLVQVDPSVSWRVS